jgi:hypothetical protein
VAFKWDRSRGVCLECNLCGAYLASGYPTNPSAMRFAEAVGWRNISHPRYGSTGNYHLCPSCVTPKPKDNSMNNSAAVMLFEENGVRPARVQYDPDVRGQPYTETLFKCVDPSVKKDDLVIVTTGTRHGFTIAKVLDIGYIDVPVDFNDTSVRWGWIAGKFEVEAYNNILESEKKLVGLIREASANKMRDELRQSMGLNKVSLADVFIKAPTALASPHGASQADAAAAPADAPIGDGVEEAPTA